MDDLKVWWRNFSRQVDLHDWINLILIGPIVIGSFIGIPVWILMVAFDVIELVRH